MHKVVVPLALVQLREPLIYEEQRDSRWVGRPILCADDHVGVGSSDESSNVRLDLGEATIVHNAQILPSSWGHVTERPANAGKTSGRKGTMSVMGMLVRRDKPA